MLREREKERVRQRAHADVNKGDDITGRFRDKPAEGPLPLPPPRRLSFPAVKWCSTLLLLLHAATRLRRDHVISGPRWAPPPLRDDSRGRRSAFSTLANGLLLTLKAPITHASQETLQRPVCALLLQREKIKSFSTFILPADEENEIGFIFANFKMNKRTNRQTAKRDTRFLYTF